MTSTTILLILNTLNQPWNSISAKHGKFDWCFATRYLYKSSVRLLNNSWKRFRFSIKIKMALPSHLIIHEILKKTYFFHECYPVKSLPTKLAKQTYVVHVKLSERCWVSCSLLNITSQSTCIKWHFKIGITFLLKIKPRF